MSKAFICGVRGHRLDADERGFIAAQQPWGLILFGRNCETPGQIETLVHEFQDAVGWKAPVLIDQEGGLVQRLKAPHWQAYPPARQFGQLYAHAPDAALRAARANARLIAYDLHALGITINCAPVLDVARAETHDAIGSRAYSSDPETVAALATAVAEGFLEGGVVPVVKHMPGQGRARHDTHHDASSVSASVEDLAACDLRPFRKLRHLPMAMTCHVVFSEIDARPATLSPVVIRTMIRERIGYDGLLLTDDLSMKALPGTMAQKAGGAIAAGCDVALHCNGELEEARAVADAVPSLEGAALRRAEAALACRRAPADLDLEASRALVGPLLAA